jgi:hypothetical protein
LPQYIPIHLSIRTASPPTHFHPLTPTLPHTHSLSTHTRTPPPQPARTADLFKKAQNEAATLARDQIALKVLTDANKEACKVIPTAAINSLLSSAFIYSIL